MNLVGSNFNVFYENNRIRKISKCPVNSTIIREEIIKDYYETNKYLNVHIHTPEIIFLGFSENKFVVEESYCGIDAKAFSFRNKEYKFSIYLDLVSSIKRLPTEFFIDTNPRNFCLDNGIWTFVDFFPPDPFKYRVNVVLQKYFEESFPRNKKIQDYIGRKESYRETNKRINRLKTYFNL